MSWSFAVIAKVLIHRLVVTQDMSQTVVTLMCTELYGLYSPARNPLTEFINLLIAPLLHCDLQRSSLCDIASRVLRVRVNLGLRAGERTTSVTAQQLMTALALLYSVPKNNLFLSSHLLMCVCVCVCVCVCKLKSCERHKTYGETSGVALPIVNISTRWR